MREFGFAIVGGGVIAPFHARAIAELPNARLVAVADSIAERAQQRGEEFGVDHYTDLAPMLARPDVDVVSVCVPSGLHAAIGVQAAQAGKHVVVEKPIDVSLDNADALLEAVRQAGVKLTVISQHRFDEGVQELRGLIDSGRLGRLILGDAIVKWYRTQQYYESGDWRGTWDLDGGGSLMNQGVHYVDVLRWLMGPVDRVFARTATAGHRIEVEDIALALLRFRNGAVGVLEASTAVFPGFSERVEITGSEGTVILESGRMLVRALKDEQGEARDYGSKLRLTGGQDAAGASDPAAIPHVSHRRQLADFLDAIENDREPLVTGEEARQTLELILAVYESARSDREIELPLKTPTAGGHGG